MRGLESYLDPSAPFEVVEVLDRLRRRGWGDYLDALADDSSYAMNGKLMYSRIGRRLGRNPQRVKIDLDKLKEEAGKLCGDPDSDNDDQVSHDPETPT